MWTGCEDGGEPTGRRVDLSRTDDPGLERVDIRSGLGRLALVPPRVLPKHVEVGGLALVKSVRDVLPTIVAHQEITQGVDIATDKREAVALTRIVAPGGIANEHDVRGWRETDGRRGIREECDRASGLPVISKESVRRDLTEARDDLAGRIG